MPQFSGDLVPVLGAMPQRPPPALQPHRTGSSFRSPRQSGKRFFFPPIPPLLRHSAVAPPRAALPWSPPGLCPLGDQGNFPRQEGQSFQRQPGVPPPPPPPVGFPKRKRPLFVPPFPAARLFGPPFGVSPFVVCPPPTPPVRKILHFFYREKASTSAPSQSAMSPSPKTKDSPFAPNRASPALSD